jgi:uncharacterized protein YceK
LLRIVLISIASFAVFVGLVLLGLLLGLITVIQKRARVSLALAALVIMMGCGHVMGALGPSPGPVVNPGTPSGTYMIVISAVGTQTTATVSVTIQ